MLWASRIADETAEHYAELRNRRIPRVPAMLMTLMFHHVLCRSVLYSDHFEDAVGAMIGPIEEDARRD